MILRIDNLSDREYHDINGEYGGYVSSTQLKRYQSSPKYFAYSLVHAEEQTDAMKFGALFHSLMQCMANNTLDEAVEKWKNQIVVFSPPINELSGKKYGAATKVYKEALQTFLAANADKVFATMEDITTIESMVRSMFIECGKTSKQLKSLVKGAKGSEVSFFYEGEGVRLKIRPDMFTNGKLIDWKTTTLGDLSEDSIARAIIKYGYHISLSMYQYVLHKATGKWYTPLLVFVQKQAPYDCVICDISEWCYDYNKDLDDVSLGVGALEFTRLLKLHKECLESDKWEGAESLIPKENKAIMKPSVPAWYGMKLLNE